jgi:hypothetical protein
MPLRSFVLKYKSQTHQSRIDVVLQNGRDLPLVINSIEEFTAVASVFNRGDAIILGARRR